MDPNNYPKESLYRTALADKKYYLLNVKFHHTASPHLAENTFPIVVFCTEKELNRIEDVYSRNIEAKITGNKSNSYYTYSSYYINNKPFRVISQEVPKFNCEFALDEAFRLYGTNKDLGRFTSREEFEYDML